ncbi:hypothetical protein NQ318_015898 [Aromia moschata]|uniref:Dynein regulatory complex subunit 2 n=1 Tax=Aromia moschata TaxID=1265417 RepID=A0AAV8Y1W9_9CUCU|nr:hypothetical protein NQ318_015898 [Aromia moschata]
MPPKLTPEEKKALKAAKKEEKKRQKIEQDKQVNRDYLGREVKYGQLTLKRHKREWRQMLVNLALPKMREDLEFAWHNFERVVDCKNFTISLLMDELKEAEDSYMLNAKNQVECIDKLIGLFNERIEELQADYENEIVKFQEQHEQYCEQLRLSAEDEENHIKTVQYMLEVAMKEATQNIRTDYFSKQSSVENKYVLNMKVTKGTLEKKLQNIMKEAVKFFHSYSVRIEQIKMKHDELKSQDDPIQELLLTQLEKIRKACEYLKVLRVKLNDSQEVLGQKLKEAHHENDFFSNTFSLLKTRLEIDRKKDMQQLICLTVNFNKTFDYLKSLQGKVENILQLSAVCRKLETEKEKVVPFPVTIQRILSDPDDKDEGPKEFLPSMDLFWQRVAQVEASRYALNEEKECIKCPIPERNIIGRAVKHITEGALEQKKYEKQNIPRFSSSVVHFDIDE